MRKMVQEAKTLLRTTQYHPKVLFLITVSFQHDKTFCSIIIRPKTNSLFLNKQYLETFGCVLIKVNDDK